MLKTYLAHAIEATDGASTYDENVKYLLADRQVLAYILIYAITEFRDMTMDQAMDCIGDEIEIGARAADPGLSNLGSIRGTDTEDSVPGEGTNIYMMSDSMHI